MKYEERQKLGEILTELQGLRARADLYRDSEALADAVFRELALAREIGQKFDPLAENCHVCGSGYWNFAPANPGTAPDYQTETACRGVTEHLGRHAAEMARGIHPTRDASAWYPLRLSLKIIGDYVHPVVTP
jgi:hypothetical protein